MLGIGSKSLDVKLTQYLQNECKHSKTSINNSQKHQPFTKL